MMLRPCAITAFFVTTLLCAASSFSAEERPPNLIVLFADDLGYADLGCQGSTDVVSPRIDTLAKNGTRCTAAYVTAPLCSPSRAGLLTGRYQQKFGHEFNLGPEHTRTTGLALSQRTIADRLKSAGYTSAVIGKWDLGAKPEYHPLRRGFDFFYGFLGGSRQHSPKPPQRQFFNVMQQQQSPVTETTWSSDAYSQAAVEFVERNRERPFFLFVSFTAPHWPMEAPPRDLARFAHVADLHRRTFLAMMAGLDRGVGRILDALSKFDLTERTLVIFLSDNGGPTGEKRTAPDAAFALGQNTSRNDPLRGVKGELYEGGIRVPMLVQWPGVVPAGKVCDAPISTLDIAATACAIAGLKLDDSLDGVNMLPAIKGTAAAERSLYWRLGELAAMRRGDWKLVARPNKPEELYHLGSDIAESKNRRDDEADQFDSMRAELNRWQATLARPSWNSPQRAAAAADADVIVYGSTPGGCCAAIAAAREGASVILIEPTDHVGGMNTGGLSHCDSNQMVRSTLMGLFHEWHTRIVKDYTDRGQEPPYNPAKKDQARWTFEPHVAMRVTMQMLDEAGVKVLTERYLQSVEKEGPRITVVRTSNGKFTAKVWIDGTYEGDLMAAAGVDWTIGREGRNEYGESLSGKRYPKPKMNINGFDDAGNPLPLITTDDAGPEDARDKNLMTYSFRLCLTADPANRVPMPEPANYDPARFEIIRRYLKLSGSSEQVGFDLYPIPGGKLDGNNSIGKQFSIGLVGGGNAWHAADEAGRKKIWEAHKQYTLEFYKFITADPAVPASIRARYAKLGLCKNEFPGYGHFSPTLYVRESRRMKGLYVINQKDILKEPAKADPIAISSFPIDSHDVQRIAIRGGGVINEGTIFPVRDQKLHQGYAYHVPYRAVLPRREQCNNLLVPVALSCTHVGISSLRIEGAWMAIGQGVGVAAALAAKRGVAVQEVDYLELRKRLLAQGQALDLPESPRPDTAEKANATSLVPMLRPALAPNSTGCESCG